MKFSGSGLHENGRMFAFGSLCGLRGDRITDRFKLRFRLLGVAAYKRSQFPEIRGEFVPLRRLYGYHAHSGALQHAALLRILAFGKTPCQNKIRLKSQYLLGAALGRETLQLRQHIIVVALRYADQLLFFSESHYIVGMPRIERNDAQSFSPGTQRHEKKKDKDIWNYSGCHAVLPSSDL